MKYIRHFLVGVLTTVVGVIALSFVALGVINVVGLINAARPLGDAPWWFMLFSVFCVLPLGTMVLVTLGEILLLGSDHD